MRPLVVIIAALSSSAAFTPTTRSLSKALRRVVVGPRYESPKPLEDADKDELMMSKDVLDLDKLTEQQKQLATTAGVESKELTDKPLQSLAIFLGGLALLLGLGRLPALFWLIGSASLADDAFREELFEVLLLKKPFSERSEELTTQVLVILAACGVAVLGEVSINIISPLSVTPV